MAARYNRKHLDLAREKIRVSQLVNLLTDNALGKLELTSDRLRSIEILLRKALPDLSAVDMAIDHAQPFAVLAPVMDDATSWEQAFTPGSKPDPDEAKH